MWISMATMQAIVVGAYGGIGQSLCSLIAESGGKAFLVGRSEESLRALANHHGWGYAVADAMDWSQLDAAVTQGVTHLGGIDAAINLAGSVLLKPMHLTSRSEWDATLGTNLTTAAGLIRAAVPKMFGQGGSIVLVSSAAASIGLANHEAIAASKAGIEGLVRSAATTYAGKNIRVNAVAPGLVQTAMTERVWSNPRSAEISLAMHPLGRFGQSATSPAPFTGSRIQSKLDHRSSPRRGWRARD
jgi:NAD(P)-dependent dehydrogenase (short-subunit alcohol dehydrogenase family)